MSLHYSAPLLIRKQQQVPKNNVKSDFLQPNPFSSSTGTFSAFVTPIITPTYGPTVLNLMCLGGQLHPKPLVPSLDSADLIVGGRNQFKKNNPLPD